MLIVNIETLFIVIIQPEAVHGRLVEPQTSHGLQTAKEPGNVLYTIECILVFTLETSGHRTLLNYALNATFKTLKLIS